MTVENKMEESSGDSSGSGDGRRGEKEKEDYSIASQGHSSPGDAGGSNDGSATPEQEQEKSTTHPQSTQQSPTAPPPPPNGGYGWICTACSATINAHTWGLNSSYGVFLAHYLATDAFPGATPLEYAFVGSLSISIAMLVSPLATTTIRYFGNRACLFIGVVLESASFIGASFASEIWHLFLSQGVCFGLGMGFLFIGSVGIVPQWFTSRRSLANGIATSGSGLGGLVYSLAAGAMIRSIGLPWAFRTLGIICFVVNATCAALMRDRNKIIGTTFLAFDVNILVRPEYILIALWGWFSMLAYVVLIFSLANYANEIGLSASQAATISALFNFGQFLGRPPIGYFSDTVGRLNMAGGTTFLAGLFALAIWIPAKNYGVLIFYSIVGGTVAGTFWCTIAPVTAEVVGLKHVSSGLNLMWLAITLPVTFSEPIALEMADGTGSYLGTQLWTGLMYIAASLCVLLLRGWKIGVEEELKRMKEEGSEELEVSGEDPVRARVAGRRVIWREFWRWRKI